MTKGSLLAAALFLGAAALGQARQAPPIRQGLVKPIWVTTLPQQAGRVYAMGLAPLASGQTEAVTQAAQNARAEVITRLRANVKSETSVVSRSTLTKDTTGKATGSSEQQVGQNTRIQTQATGIPGLVVEESWLDAKGGTAYALAYLDVPIAEREIRSRFAAEKNDLAQEGDTPAAPRERMRLLNRLKNAQAELVRLDDLAGLIAAGGGDDQLRGQVRTSRLAVDRRLDQLRGSLTLSLDKTSQGASGVAGILRNAALKAGMGWAETGGEFQLVMDYRSDAKTAKVDLQRQSWNGWWRGGWVSHTVNASSGIIVARGVLTVTLRDKAGTEYESVDVEAKGLGVTEFQAEQRLKDDFRTKLEATFSQWLDNLVRD